MIVPQRSFREHPSRRADEKHRDDDRESVVHGHILAGAPTLVAVWPTDDTDQPIDITELAAGLRRLLDAIRAGEMSADAGTVARLEGAALACEALAAGVKPKDV